MIRDILLIKRYKNLRNRKRIKDFTVSFQDSNPLCGDMVTVYLSIEGSKIVNAGFEGKGCVLSMVSTDMLMDYVKGKKVDELLKIEKELMFKITGFKNLPPSRVKCVLLPYKALKMALIKYMASKQSQG